MSASPNLKELQRVWFFVDGSNLIHRLRESNVQIPSLHKVLDRCCRLNFGAREFVRAIFFTTPTLCKEAEAFHGPDFLKGIRVSHGDEVFLDKRRTKEKGVDALLVADLVYHAAQKNLDLAVLVSQDTDFRFAIQRVEDFGFRTAVLALTHGCDPRLSGACDWYVELSRDRLIAENLACEPPTS